MKTKSLLSATQIKNFYFTLIPIKGFPRISSVSFFTGIFYLFFIKISCFRSKGSFLVYSYVITGVTGKNTVLRKSLYI